MTRLNRSLEDLATRGEPRGALDVFAAATTDTKLAASSSRKATRPWAAFAGAFAGVLVVGTVAAVLLGGTPGGQDARDPLILQEDGAVLLVSGPSNGGEDALIYGQLVVGEGGCLAVSWDEIGTFPLVFPAGSRLVSGGAAATVSVPGVGNLSVGQWLTGGGGYHTLPSSDPRMPIIPEACAGTGDEVAVAWTLTAESTTTTLFVEPADLPPGSQTPTTVPAGAALDWFDFIPTMVQLAWRETADGAEMCWRTIYAEECVDDNFLSPEVIVIPTHFTQVVVITRPQMSGQAPERVILELSTGDRLEVALQYHGSVVLLYGLSDRLEGAGIVSAAAAPYPPLNCVTPPPSAIQILDPHFTLNTDPAASPGDIIEVFIGGEAGTNGSGLLTWQCWDGSEWINTHIGGLAPLDTEVEPSIYRWEAQPRWASVGVEVPATFRALVPELPPGLHRISTSVGSMGTFTYIEIGTESANAPAPAPFSRMIRVVDVRLDPSYRQEPFVSAGPVTLILESGEELHMPAGTPLPASCDLLDPPDQVSERPCSGVVALAENGRTVLAFLVFHTERIETGYPEQTLVQITTYQLSDSSVTIDYGITLALAPEFTDACTWYPGSIIGAAEFDALGRVKALHCYMRD